MTKRDFNPLNFPYGYDLQIDLARIHKQTPLDRIFDVGANIGETVECWISLFPQALVYAFEPGEKAFIRLSKVAEKSNRIRLFNFALGATTLEVHAIKQAHHACLSMKWSSPAPVQGKTVSIEVQTLEEICKKNEIQTIDFLKIDTEGWELEVLRGAENFITEGKIKLVLCEVGFSAKDQMHTPLSELMIFMEKYGYSLFALYDHCYWEGSLNFANALFVSESTKKSMKKVCHENFWKTLV